MKIENIKLKEEMNIKYIQIENKIRPNDKELQEKLFNYQNQNNDYINKINVLKDENINLNRIIKDLEEVLFKI